MAGKQPAHRGRALILGMVECFQAGALAIGVRRRCRVQALSGREGRRLGGQLLGGKPRGVSSRLRADEEHVALDRDNRLVARLCGVGLGVDGDLVRASTETFAGAPPVGWGDLDSPGCQVLGHRSAVRFLLQGGHLGPDGGLEGEAIAGRTPGLGDPVRVLGQWDQGGRVGDADSAGIKLLEERGGQSE